MENGNHEQDLHSTNNKLNPFLSVWLHPKLTARSMMENNQIGLAFIIIILGSFGSIMTGLIDSELYNLSVLVITILILIISPIAGIITISFSVLLFWLFGKLFKGTATYKQVFISYSLAILPYIILVPLYFIWLVTSPETLLGLYSDIPVIGIIALIATFICAIWMIVISIGVIAEAHQFSNWKAFFTILIPSLIIGLLVFILVFILVIVVIGIGSVMI